jgi:hypothetical protein
VTTITIMESTDSVDLPNATDGREFNYAALPPDVATSVRRAADTIRRRLGGTTLEVGEQLLFVREHLEHGQWLAWLRAEFNWSETSARNYMGLARLTRECPEAHALPLSTAVAIGTAPDELREALLAEVRAGDIPPCAQVRRRIMRHLEKQEAELVPEAPSGPIGEEAAALMTQLGIAAPVPPERTTQATSFPAPLPLPYVDDDASFDAKELEAERVEVCAFCGGNREFQGWTELYTHHNGVSICYACAEEIQTRMFMHRSEAEEELNNWGNEELPV